MLCPVPGSSSRRRRRGGGRLPSPAAHPVPRRSAARPRGGTVQPSEERSRISAVLCLGTSIYCLPIAMLIFALILSSCPSSAARTGSCKDTCPSELLLAALQFAGVQLHDVSSKDEPNRTTYPDHKGQEFLPSTTRRGRKKISTTRDGPGGHCTLADQSKPRAAPVPGASDASQPPHALPSTLHLQSSIPYFPHLGPAVLVFIFNLKKNKIKLK